MSKRDDNGTRQSYNQFMQQYGILNDKFYCFVLVSCAYIAIIVMQWETFHVSKLLLMVVVAP